MQHGTARRLCIYSCSHKVHNILKQLNPRESVGMDNISSHLLRLSSPSISTEVTKLNIHFINTQSIPREWKSSNITPVYKKGSKTDKANYRLVTILTTLSKVFEKVIYDQIYPVMSPLLSRNLSGYMKGHSCATEILKTTQKGVK